MKIKFAGYRQVKEIELADVQKMVGSGWSDLLRRLIEDLFELGWNGELLQVKEKFGGLRFYIGGGSDAIHNRIREAENESYRVCEECGAAGQLRRGGWLKTLCDAHAGDRKLYDEDDD